MDVILGKGPIIGDNNFNEELLDISFVPIMVKMEKPLIALHM